MLRSSTRRTNHKWPKRSWLMQYTQLSLKWTLKWRSATLPNMQNNNNNNVTIDRGKNKETITWPLEPVVHSKLCHVFYIIRWATSIVGVGQLLVGLESWLKGHPRLVCPWLTSAWHYCPTILHCCAPFQKCRELQMQWGQDNMGQISSQHKKIGPPTAHLAPNIQVLEPPHMRLRRTSSPAGKQSSLTYKKHLCVYLFVYGETEEGYLSMEFQPQFNNASESVDFRSLFIDEWEAGVSSCSI